MKRVKQDSSRKPGPMQPEQWLVATTCQVCKTAIDQGAARIMVAALKFAVEVDGDDPSGCQLSRASMVRVGSSEEQRRSWKVGKLISYCNDCAQGIDDFPISNPWSLGKRGDTKPVNESASLETCEAEMKAEAAATHKTMSESLAHDDMRRLNSSRSAPAESDLMARSVQLEHAAAKSAASQQCGQALEATSEIAKKPVAVHSGNARTTAASEPLGGKTTSQTPKVLKCPSVPGDASSNATSRKALGRGIQPERCGEKTQHGSVNSRPNDQRSIEDGGCPRLTYGMPRYSTREIETLPAVC